MSLLWPMKSAQLTTAAEGSLAIQRSFTTQRRSCKSNSKEDMSGK
jgi:hypothetical protein